MELGELCRKTLAIFECEKVEQLSDRIKECVIANDTEKYKSFFHSVNGDLQTDWLQKIFQYYEADRETKKQDYTPKSLGETIARLSECDNETWCLDMCAGSGALTIQKWNSNHDIKFVCWEYDEKVIPYLLFNLAIRNITAIVQQCDVLENEVFRSYRVTTGKNFSEVVEVESVDFPKIDTCISNPPYNMKWQLPPLAQMQPRFSNCELPPASNANYAFILTAIEKSDRVAMIMPNGILSTDNAAEKAIREYLLENNLVESVVLCPDKMFESTTIATCLITFCKSRQTQKIEMIDMRNIYISETREQNGQFGGASHTARTYKKEIKVFSKEQQEQILKAVRELKSESMFCNAVSLSTVKENDYILTPSRYIDFIEQQETHRPYSDIVKDLNRITAEKNQCKLIINETIAKQLGIYCVYEGEQRGALPKETVALVEQVSGERLLADDCIKCTKNKNELTFQNNGKSDLSFILRMILRDWKANVIRLNERQNVYLAELRDALLPDLLSGKIEIATNKEGCNETAENH